MDAYLKTLTQYCKLFKLRIALTLSGQSYVNEGTNQDNHKSELKKMYRVTNSHDNVQNIIQDALNNTI